MTKSNVLKKSAAKLQIFQEGNARFFASVDDAGRISKDLSTFYNPVMKFNRDISVLMLNSLHRLDKRYSSLQIADILAGSGVRSLRFLTELDEGIIKNITVNDQNPDFPKIFEDNMKLMVALTRKNKPSAKSKNKQKDRPNDLSIQNSSCKPIDRSKVIIKNTDANLVLLESKGFDYIEIDPFGSPNDFLESSNLRISRKGLLALTATDTAPLCGTFINTCQRKYFAKPLRNHLMHEVGLRILIRKIQLVGAQYDKALTPVFSYSKDHYFRVFLVANKGRHLSDQILKEHNYLLYCSNCMDTEISAFNKAKCASCGADKEYAGPLWTGKLFDEKLALNMQKSCKDVSDAKTLGVMAGECGTLDNVGFFDIHAIAKKFRLKIPPFNDLISSITQKGYSASRTHFSLTGIKTDMSIAELIGLMRKI